MKAVRLIQPGDPLQSQNVPLPEPGFEDVVVRVKAAGICHSDAHYRAGVSPVRPLPLTLGHEVAGIVEQVGPGVVNFKPGERVCLHYLVTCGQCEYCRQGSEQFCVSGSMIGKYRDGGFAEAILIPARSVFKLPEEIPFEQGAIMMCSAATSFHALRKARLSAGETVAIFGVGGLGAAAVQLARELGALQVYAVDLHPKKLDLAKHYGAIPVDAKEDHPAEQIKAYTKGRGVDVALDLTGLPETIEQAIQSVALFGRVGLVGLSDRQVTIDPYNQLIMREAEIIGVADHLAQELPALIEFVRQGKLDLSEVVSEKLPLDAGRINQALDMLDEYHLEGRAVILP